MLVDISIASVYNNGPLPHGLARCAPDTRVAILALSQALQNRSRTLRLSDLFRSHDLQQHAHEDWVTGRKKAYSPPAGGSMHEAGRAIDIDLKAIGMPLAEFWTLAARFGFTPIISKPNPALPEAWHFDHRGSHQRVYDYIRSGKAGEQHSPYQQMAISAILFAGLEIDNLPNQNVAIVQSGLIRLGYDIGPIDGINGRRTQAALDRIHQDQGTAVHSVLDQLREKWPHEYTQE